MIDIEKLRSLRLAHPFQSFYLLLENGDRILVDRPLSFGMAPDGSRMGVIAPEACGYFIRQQLKTRFLLHQQNERIANHSVLPGNAF